MKRARIIAWLLCGCLLLTMTACGNKGPLELPEEEQRKKSRGGGGNGY